MFNGMKATGTGNWYRLVLTIVLLSVNVDAEKHKRQIFREQVLPALGGKIPEEAFRTDRLALNRLNKEGISVPDGVVLDARHVQKHPHSDQIIPEVLKVYLTPDGRYVPPEGRYHYNHPKSVDTTYVIRAPYTRTGGNKHSNNFGGSKHRGYPKSQAYTSFRQFVPLAPPSKPGVYKPIVTPLIIPGNSDLLEDAYLPTWNIGYDWDTVYQPLDDYYVNNIALFNSHQIITDYQGFLHDYHERSSRHVGSKSANNKNQHHFSSQDRTQGSRVLGTNSRSTSHQTVRLNVGSVQSSDYTNLTKIPETSFSCHGRKGMFADIETKCQVFHSCSGWSKTSSLCPAGTAFSDAKKRCEWWNTVQCKR